MRFNGFYPALVLTAGLICCTKQTGRNPALALSDKALLDSCINGAPVYYKNDTKTIFPGTNGPHGPYQLRFNSIAATALTDNGKLPVGKNMPDGAFIVKDVYSGSKIWLYAFMYKSGGSWLWAEIEPNGSVHHSVTGNASVCTGCHSQAGNRDLLLTFKDY